MTIKKHKISLLSKYPSLGEEIANSITHGIGAALSIAALVLLVVFAALQGDAWRVVGFSIFGSSLFILYLTSTLYHSFTNPRVKRIFRVLDHSMVFILIAGSYTPITLTVLRGPWGWTLFGLIWGLAIFGIVMKIAFFDRFNALSVVLYILMGWLVVIALKPLLLAAPLGLMIWMGIGGLSYTLGVIFYAWERLPFNHAVWHLFVLGGSISHFFGMLFHLA
ncbi:MAG: hemolysin III family protein [Candidatus Marinimicrobia bacterium]|nr:hemolysin III family protein [Candidatus Neomarinimicrobiota bacterium]